jgi:catechol 2,3-dioxygenase-like lactoylglutathione lyase family enzyme
MNFVMRTLVLAALVVAGCRSSREEVHGLALVAQQCETNDLGCPRPILYVSNLDTSIAYYRDKLGFRFDWTDGDPPDFGSVTRGATQIFMCERCQGHPGGWVWVMTRDVDGLYGELKQRGALIQSPPENKPWGVREMRVADIDGNVLRIGSPIRQ